MSHAFNDAIGICKTILRNGYDAHVINTPLQAKLMSPDGPIGIDIACEPDLATLQKLFPNMQAHENPAYVACMHEGDVSYHFYPLPVEDASHPERAILRIAPRMVEKVDFSKRIDNYLSRFRSNEEEDAFAGFEDINSGSIALVGLPDEMLTSNYLLAIRALRFAANYQLPIMPNTWVAIVRAGSRILDYVPTQEIMDEWRKVKPTAMWKFVKLMHEAHILQGLVPEVAALSCIKQTRDDGEEEAVLDHTIACMRHYAEGEFHQDWLGTLATFFHDVGKLYAAQYHNGKWTFYQHHRVGAKVTRKILRRLHFLAEDIDLICHLVRYHMRFHFMLTDRGIRRFKALDEYPRLIEMTRADIMSRDGSYTYFNHNMKYLERAETPEQMLEPLLNGNEIMQHTALAPGPMIGVLREALLQAQIAGEVEDTEGAIAFVRAYAQKTVG